MKITWKNQGRSMRLRLPYSTAGYVEGPEGSACPNCKTSPLRARSNEQNVVGNDTIKGRARCIDCDQLIGGDIVVKVNTLFGIEEDRAVLVNGRPRVY